MTKIPSVRTVSSVKSLGFCAVLGLLTFCCEPVLATTMTTGLCNTGTTVQGNGCSGLLNAAAQDPSYALLAGNPLNSTTSYAMNPPNVAYVAADLLSEWIGPTTTDTGACCGPGDYTYQLTFTVFGTGWVPIAGQWAADNEATMFLTGSNGTTGEGGTNGAPSSQEVWTPFSFGFNQVSNVPLGTNYELTFVVDNTGNVNTPTALRVEFDNAAPEPSTSGALGAGMVIIGFIKRKRLRRPALN
jgi:hypothetical protein